MGWMIPWKANKEDSKTIGQGGRGETEEEVLRGFR